MTEAERQALCLVSVKCKRVELCDKVSAERVCRGLVVEEETAKHLHEKGDTTEAWRTGWNFHM